MRDAYITPAVLIALHLFLFLFLETRPNVLSSDPILWKYNIAIPKHLTPVQAWVESLRHYDARHVGLADLHPDVFAVMPR